MAITSVGTKNTRAHDAFLRMRDLVLSPMLTPTGYLHAMDHGRRAIELDPDYAAALGLMSSFQWLDWHNGWSGDTQDVVVERANALAKRAMEANPEEPLANIAVAVAARFQSDPERGEKAGRKALSLSPDSALALFSVAEIIGTSGRPEEAVPLLERAIRLDPGWSQQYLQFLGQVHFLQGHFETAALLFRERLQLARDTDIGRAWLASTLGHLGKSTRRASSGMN